ncbi:hypothetical protein ACUW9N_001264 [Staphylococcus auricularis]|nr:hypothetical protein JCM2421_01830 [Staphylococcus auricularis]SQJ06513.1 Uncharacterised protein [Staphylococcus auricularis]
MKLKLIYRKYFVKIFTNSEDAGVEGVGKSGSDGSFFHKIDQAVTPGLKIYLCSRVN